MKKYNTTAIPYANATPHIGTAMDYLYGDILLRYYTSQDHDALLSIGTDEHGTKIEQKAIDNNITPQELVDSLQPEFQKMRTALNLDFNHIVNVRTTDPDHVRRVQDIWTKLDEAGVIYKSTYEGWYCSGCESFIPENEAKELNYVCPDHNKPLEKLSEDNYYLKVSQFTDQIREFAANSVVPSWRGKEILELIKDGAQDVSISRPKDKLSWGISVPGDNTQVMYVWIDALSNYITALGYPDSDWQKDFWPANVEIVGKDILRFHAIIWPAMLLALGLELPEKLLVHGFVNVGGSKMSKSIGNVVSPLEIIENYGTDAFRYYFARHIPTFDDGDFTWEKFEAAYNGELANNLGNLVSRTTNMIKKYCDGNIPEITQNFGSLSYKSHIEDFKLYLALGEVFLIATGCNEDIDEDKPWEIYKNDDKDKLEEVLGSYVARLVELSDMLQPFLPETAKKIREIFGGDKLPDEIPMLFPKKYLHSEEPARK